MGFNNLAETASTRTREVRNSHAAEQVHDIARLKSQGSRQFDAVA
jgi:hypothetical protein